MNWKSTIAAVSAGVAGGIIISQTLTKETLTPESALKKVKSAVKHNHELEGAWIYLQPESFVKDRLNYKVYKGGLTINEAGEVNHFDFVADATTGTILDFYKQP
ncbi:PepSY domain-containing protein [Tuberibacillus sp. Marseille-P3662]|uniref:PepSY domain-containing protein n=1 Tax=Tuberibacillus sp. Marseille-P3662 TaxID=1965358 RepID=UPI000A1CD7FE|nr:PepSY domain-containing protein [Tuberibacillus sp. Marseille-P3662]